MTIFSRLKKYWQTIESFKKSLKRWRVSTDRPKLDSLDYLTSLGLLKNQILILSVLFDCRYLTSAKNWSQPWIVIAFANAFLLYFRLEKIYLCGLLIVFFSDDFLRCFGLEERFKFLPLIAYSTYCSIAILKTFFSLYIQMFKWISKKNVKMTFQASLWYPRAALHIK